MKRSTEKYFFVAKLFGDMIFLEKPRIAQELIFVGLKITRAKSKAANVGHKGFDSILA